MIESVDKIFVVKTGTQLMMNEKVRANCLAQMVALTRMGKRVIHIPSGIVAHGALEDPELGERRHCDNDRRKLAKLGEVPYICNVSGLPMRMGVPCYTRLFTKNQFRSPEGRERILDAIRTGFGIGGIVSLNEADHRASPGNEFNNNDIFGAEVVGVAKEICIVVWYLMLTGVDGLLDGPPDDPRSQLIETVVAGDDSWRKYDTSATSEWGTGGIAGKCEGGLLALKNGAEWSVIANGMDHTDSPILDFCSGIPVRGTWFRNGRG